MNRLLKGKFLLLSLLGAVLSTQAQVGGSGVPDAKMAPGSAATSTGLESIYSPNLFEGTLNVGIPIYNFSAENGSYGVSLSYNTKGVRVDEVSTPVGVHWNLVAEPSISRIVKDIPDEYYKESTPTIGIPGFAVWDTANANHYIKGKYVTYTETPQQQAQPDVYRDKESDDFVLSFGGRTIKFNLGSDLHVFTQPHKNLSIKLLVGGNALLGIPGQPLPASIGSQFSDDVSILVRDEQGNEYLFESGDTDRATYYSSDHKNQQLSTDNSDPPNALLAYAYFTTRWVLKKVTFSNGKQINYFYNARRNAEYYDQYTQSSVREDWSVNPHTVWHSDFTVGPRKVADSFIQLSRIEYPNGVAADFIYDPVEVTESNARLLKGIRVSGSATECLNYIFNRTMINGRWFLNAVSLRSCDEQVDEPLYSFDYHPVQLPPRLNNGQDLYGYYNGDSIANHFGQYPADWPSQARIGVPRHYNSPVADLQYGIVRAYNPALAKAGILTKVSNAFGGEVSFRYKAVNAPGGLASVMSLPGFSDFFLGTTQPDGVAIDSIIEKDKYHPANTRVTVFNQQDGQLFMPGGRFHYPDYIDDASNAWQKVLFQNMFLTAHDLVNGSNHGYSTVEMTTMTAAGTQLSRKVINFTNMVENGNSRYFKVPGSKDYFEFPYTDKQYLKSWELGLPKEIKEYDQNNVLVARTVNQYSFSNVDLSAASYITSTKTARVNTGTSIPVPYNGPQGPFYPNKKVITDTYYPFIGWALLAFSAVEKYVSAGQVIRDTTRYEYDGKQNLSVISTTNSEGGIEKTIQVYNYSITNPQAQTTLVGMNNSGLEKIISIERWKEGTGAYPANVFSRKLVSSSINTFEYQNGLLRPKSVYSLNINTPLTFTAYTGIQPNAPIADPYAKVISAYQGQTVADFENVSQVTAYDNDGNPAETRMADQAFSKAVIWDNATGNKLAEATNCHINEIAYNGFETASNGNFTVLNPNNIVSVNSIPGGGINGRSAYLLTTNPVQSKIMISGLTPNKPYFVSFWCNGGIPSFSGAGFSSLSLDTMAVKGYWTLYRGTFVPLNTAQVGFTSFTNNMYLDEIRIHPVSAVMNSWTYLPLHGVSAETDPNGRITYFEYDAMGRLSITRDQNDNILSKTEFVINGND